MERRGAGLSELAISANSQLKAEAIGAVAQHCGSTLRTLRLEGCDQLPTECIAPLRSLTALQVELSASSPLIATDCH